MYEDEGNASAELPVLTFNGEYSMPQKGDFVLVLHMPNGSSRGFVLGTYYGENNKPKVNSGYRKDLGGGAYIASKNGDIEFHGSAGTVTLNQIINFMKSSE